MVFMIHGRRNTTEYVRWQSMKARCFNKNNKGYKDYGGRGITVCKRWMKFENFYADMGSAPPMTYLDRINNNGNYTPSNCRWASVRDSQNNKRSVYFLTVNGVRMSLTQWCDKLKISHWTVRRRIKDGWSHHDALFKPLMTSHVAMKWR